MGRVGRVLFRWLVMADVEGGHLGIENVGRELAQLFQQLEHMSMVLGVVLTYIL
jgi:hypothetical protein